MSMLKDFRVGDLVTFNAEAVRRTSGWLYANNIDLSIPFVVRNKSPFGDYYCTTKRKDGETFEAVLPDSYIEYWVQKEIKMGDFL